MDRITYGRHRNPVMAATVVGLAATLAVAVAIPAFGHTALVSATPAEGATVEAPGQVLLQFNEPLIDVGGELSVLAADGVETALAVTYPSPDTAAAALPALPPGTTAVTWRVVSADGHPVEGVLTFEVAAPPQPSPSETPAAVASPTPTPSPSPSASPILVVDPVSAQAEPAGGLPAWLWAALVATVVAATSVAMATSRRR